MKLKKPNLLKRAFDRLSWAGQATVVVAITIAYLMSVMISTTFMANYCLSLWGSIGFIIGGLGGTAAWGVIGYFGIIRPLK